MLSLLQPEELRGFQTYLSTRFFNGKKTLVVFFARWKKLFLDAPHERDYSAEAFLAGTGIHPRRMDKLSSALYALVCNYLAILEFQENEQAQHEMLLFAIEKRGAGKQETESLFEKMLNRTAEEKESPDKVLRLMKIRWLYAEMSIRTRETRSLWQENFHDLHDLLDQYYQLQKLKLASATTNAKNIYNHAEDNPAEKFLAYLQHSKADAELSPLSRAYFLTIQMLRSENGKDAFGELLLLLGGKAHLFDRREALELYSYALNFCISHSNQGKPEHLKDASVLYLQLLENKLILENEELPPQQFKNIVALHCRLGMLDWVATFIDEYNQFLPKKSQHFALTYNQAVLSYYRQDYAHAIHQFKEIIANLSEDVFYALDARVFLWKSFFENLDHNTMKEVDEMYRLYDAFRLYIDRNDKISTFHKQHYRNFIREFKRFTEIINRQPASPKHLSELREEVFNMDFVSNKEWFLQKIDVFLKNAKDHS